MANRVSNFDLTPCFQTRLVDRAGVGSSFYSNGLLWLPGKKREHKSAPVRLTLANQIGPKRGCNLDPALTNAKGYIRYGF